MSSITYSVNKDESLALFDEVSYRSIQVFRPSYHDVSCSVLFRRLECLSHARLQLIDRWNHRMSDEIAFFVALGFWQDEAVFLKLLRGDIAPNVRKCGAS